MKTSSPKILIYMSCYNHEKFVREAMDSIVGQTYENWELFVVNDGSTDATGDILATYTDPRIHYFDFKTNTQYVGAACFLTATCKEIEADYIACMSSDDKWEINKLEKQIEILMTHPEYKACLTWDKIIFSGSNEGMYKNNTQYSHKKNRNRFEWLVSLLLNGNCFNSCSMLMDKNIFYELDTININYRQLGDYRIWLKLAEKYPFYLLEEELTYYRRHDTNLSETSTSTEIAIRIFNEQYLIIREIMIPMEKDTFRRTFYRLLPYVECNTEEELLAEKFMVLMMHNSSSVLEQVAMDIYYAHCNSEKFISILEDLYDFSRADFFNLTGKGGLQTKLFPDIRNGKNWFSPATILLSAINACKLNEQTLHLYRYNTLFGLWDYSQLYDNRQSFHLILNFITDLRERRKKMLKSNHVLFLVAQSSTYDFSSLIHKKKAEGNECYIAFIPSIMDSMNGNCYRQASAEDAEVLPLYDPEEHSLRFAFDYSKPVDSIYYIDCISNEYESRNMAEGYSLNVEYHAILNQEIHDSLLSSDERVLQIMHSIEIYNEEVS